MKRTAVKVFCQKSNHLDLRYGVETLLDCLERNEKNGVVYHREEIYGDYDDFTDVEELIEFIKSGEK